MSGVRRCKSFVRSLNIEKLKNIKVTIRRDDIPEPDFPQPIYRGLEEPKLLVIHFKRETTKGIFDREDIVLNQEFPEERISKSRDNHSRSKSREKRSVSSEKVYDRGRERVRNTSPIDRKKSSDSRLRDNDSISRSRSRSGDRYKRYSIHRREKSRSASVKRSLSPKRRPRIIERRSRSRSPSSRPIKKPGLYIPPKSDYLRYEKKESAKKRSPSPGTSYSSKRQASRSPERGSSSNKRHSSPRSRRFGSTHRKSRSPLRKSRSPPKKSKSPKRSNSPRRRSRTPRRSERDYRSRSPYRPRRSRSRERRRDRPPEEAGHYVNLNGVPYIFKNGEYWIPAGTIPPPGYMQGGYMPPAILFPPRGYPPPMMMGRPPLPLQYRPRMYRPRIQALPETNVQIGKIQEERVPLPSEEETKKDAPVAE